MQLLAYFLVLQIGENGLISVGNNFFVYFQEIAIFVEKIFYKSLS